MFQVGLYTTTRQITEDPGYLERLRVDIGLTWVIINYSGELPHEIIRQSPLYGHRDRLARLKDLLAVDVYGRPTHGDLTRLTKQPGPHVHPGGNNHELDQAIGIARATGLQVWLLAGMHTVSDYELAMYSPLLEENNYWYEAALVHIASAHGADGLHVTHARFPMLSKLDGLLLAADRTGPGVAASLDIDHTEMVVDVRRLAGPIDNPHPVRLLQAAADESCSLGDSARDWFRFRRHLIMNNLVRVRTAVKTRLGEQFGFAVDSYPPLTAPFVGHDLARWSEVSDMANPLLAHVDIFQVGGLLATARDIHARGRSEADAIAAAAHLAGYTDVNLPTQFAAFAEGAPDSEFRRLPLVDLILTDTAATQKAVPPVLPLHPVIQGGGAPHEWPRGMIDRMIEGFRSAACAGWIFQGTSVISPTRREV